MAKPILLIRIDYLYFTQEQRFMLIDEIKKQNIYDEYFVLHTSVGAPKEDFSFEVHGSSQQFGQLKAEVKGKDIDFIINRKK